MIQRSFSANLAAVVLLASLLPIHTAWAGKRPAPKLIPVVVEEGGPALNGETWFQEGPSYALQLTRLDADSRREYIARATGLDVDPFATAADDATSFTSFLLQVKNRSEADLVINPLSCWLSAGGGKTWTPLGLADMTMAFHAVGAELPENYERIGAALLDHPVRIVGGDAIHGLLVYRGPGPKTRSFTLSVELVEGNGDVVRMVANYRRARKSDAKQTDEQQNDDPQKEDKQKDG